MQFQDRLWGSSKIQIKYAAEDKIRQWKVDEKPEDAREIKVNYGSLPGLLSHNGSYVLRS